MNFFAGMILIGVDFDEVIAFTILVQLMSDQGGFRNMYSNSLKMLYSLADEVQVWLYNEEQDLEQFFEQH